MAARTKPLQADEKVKRLHDLLLEKKSFFSLKELEKLAPKEKGIVPQSVKEALEVLVSENKVREEKIGSLKYYWCFAADKQQQLANRAEELEEETQKLEEREKQLEASSASLRASRQQTTDRETGLEALDRNRKKLDTLDAELQICKENDPAQIQALKEEAESLVSEVNAVTENILSLKTYLCNAFGMDRAEFDRSFSIPAGMDTF